MVSFTTLATILITAYVLGSVTYQLWGRKKMRPQDILPFSVAGALLGEAIWGSYLVSGPVVLGAHIVVILFAVPLMVSFDVLRQDGGWNRVVQIAKNPKALFSKASSGPAPRVRHDAARAAGAE